MKSEPLGQFALTLNRIEQHGASSSLSTTRKEVPHADLKPS